ncbi:Ribosomal protein S18 acetylase RimI [Sporobacter termitidis DSM 10068]|uniref:Ribosomal protein S18 acetylase RimI n=1 Tax=Sporobacter termitidis DSM 10068 TaxID=1123282 RepID=A0A1M5Z7D6_9FIRM|nr:GNAT family N-acetyltransferase [Sporobacter termitidis]SHI20156.1 Ribosomal protein S18 acetylase RimI [Sporobacter termitidis DSM 10068]
MTIRLLTPEDYALVRDLWTNTPGVGLNSVDDSEEGFRKYLLRNPSTCFAAVEDGGIIGVIMSGHDGRRGFIYHTAVREDRRGRGIGTALVQAASDALKREGITKAALVAFAANGAGNAFWETQGFIRRDDLVYRNKSLI